MRVLVCGGRHFSDVEFVHSVLNNLHKKNIITTLIEGDARGADRIAGYWARKNRVTNEKFPADWKKYGNAAGPIRNSQMLEEGKPDLVVAFPGGRGTRNMIERAKSVDVRVVDLSVRI